MREIKFRCWNSCSLQMVYEIGYHPHYAQDEDGIKIMAPFLEFPIMQFTGLKDKNGNEIFEGDILDFENGYISQIEFRGVAFLLRDGQLRHDLSHGLIIGNIYENPELLEAK